MKLKTHDDRLTLTNGTYHSLVNTGHTVTGGIVTAVDSSWLMSWTINRQEQYYGQPEKDVLVWVYGLFTDVPGDYIKKPLRDCTGK